MITERVAQEENQSLAHRAWRYGPVVLWMALIFYASSNEFSAANTSQVLRPILLWLFPHITESTLVVVHGVVRKGAHLGGYFILGLLAARAFLTSTKRLLHRYWFPSAFMLAAVYALLDEYHQSFVPSRTASVYDSVIDMTGALIALFMLAFWRGRKRSAANLAR
jgi:VanZ family protein